MAHLRYEETHHHFCKMRNPKYITTPVKCVIVTLLNVIRILTILPTAYRYVRNWITLYVYAILDNKGVFRSKRRLNHY
jgi:hypothetical protein